MIAKLESFVRRLTEDESFRQNALRNPERAVSLFGLVGPERHGAMHLCAAVAGPGPGPGPKNGIESCWW
jgi:hypothetical protein